MEGAYLAVILSGLLGMGIIDWRYKLALFYDAQRTLMTVTIMVAIFLAWDIAGIMLDIFFSGDSPYVTGVMIATDLPIEEVFFLTLLSYMPLVLYRKFSTV